MNSFVAFVGKEFRHILRDRWTLVILLLMPIMMLILIGFAMSTEVKGTTLRVLDPSRDAGSNAIVEKLRLSGYFTFGGYVENEAQIDQAFRRNDTGLVVVFPPHFEASRLGTDKVTVALVADGSDPNTAKTLTNYAGAIIGRWVAENTNRKVAPVTIQTETKLLYNPAMKGSYNFVPGVLGLILLLICAMMTSVSIAREKESGTMEVLLASPMKPLAIILSKTVPFFVLSCLNLLTCLLLAVYVLDVPIRGSMVALVSVSLLYIFLALLIGVLISTAVDSQLVALLISGMALMMPVMLLSGMMFPIESMPWPLEYLSNLIPARWYISAVRKVMIKGLSFESIVTEISILSVMAGVILVICLNRFRPRLE